MHVIEEEINLAKQTPTKEKRKIIREIISEEELSSYFKEAARRIYEKHGKEELVLIGILMGGDNATVKISEELSRLGNLQILKGYISISSYYDNQSSNNKPTVDAEIIKFELEGKKVIIIDLIQESNHTMACAINYLKDKNPMSIETCIILRKQGKQTVEGQTDYVIAEVPGDLWLGGGGSDGYNQYLRHFANILSLEDEPPTTP